jgi:hypothetical protein
VGGFGSGGSRWQRRKLTVDESLALDMGEFRSRLFPRAAGTIIWTWASGNKSSIGYYVSRNDGGLIFTIHYRWRDSEQVRIPVRLQETATQFGGRRWWFTCPLVVNGMACHRRAGKLFLPPGAKYFGCRTCHALTYRSCQEAHRDDRVFARLGYDLDFLRSKWPHTAEI